MKINLKDIVKKIRSVNYRELFFGMLNEGNRWIIFVSLICMTLFCINLWYKYIYHSEWSEEAKKEYLNSQERGVLFDKERFNDVVLQQEKRKSEFEKESEKEEDIFRLGEKKPE